MRYMCIQKSAFLLTISFIFNPVHFQIYMMSHLLHYKLIRYHLMYYLVLNNPVKFSSKKLFMSSLHGFRVFICWWYVKSLCCQFCEIYDLISSASWLIQYLQLLQEKNSAPGNLLSIKHFTHYIVTKENSPSKKMRGYFLKS